MISFHQYCISAVSLLFEPFPISSSGHELLLKKILSAYSWCCSTPVGWDHIMHGPVLVVIALFFYDRWRLLLTFLMNNKQYIPKLLIVGFFTEIPTMFFYFLFEHRAFESCLWIGFLITTMLLGSLWLCPQPSKSKAWTVGNGIVLGTVQGIALLPGISRLAATFCTARWLGFSNKKALELSFLIEAPISAAATVKGFMMLAKNNHLEVLNVKAGLIIMMAMIGCYSGFVITRRMIIHNTFRYWAVYMMIITCIAYIVGRGGLECMA